MQKFKFNNDKQIRLDVFLSDCLNIPRSQAEKLIAEKLVLVDGKIIDKNGFKLKNENTIEIIKSIKSSTASKKAPLDENLKIENIFEDEEILILNKPANLVIHEAPSVKSATLVDYLFDRGIFTSDKFTNKTRAGIVHRLDKDTTGAIAIAKTTKASENLSTQLKDKTMGRYYLAIISPPLPLDEALLVECNLSRSRTNRLKIAAIKESLTITKKNLNDKNIYKISGTTNMQSSKGKYSKSLFLPLLNSNDNALQLVAVKLFTGRTHQIRAHLASINRSILGDILYGDKLHQKLEINHQLLHAYLLYLEHPQTACNMLFKANIHELMLGCLQNYFPMEKVSEVIDKDRLLRRFHSLT